MIETIDAGFMDYDAALALQREFFSQVVQGDKAGVLMMVEHNHVYTLGKSGHENNLLVDENFLAKIAATYVKTDRGGDITYHGPGQLVIYPILNLDILKISLREYIYRLEQVIISTVNGWGIEADRVDGATGVWIENSRKIAAIGVRASRMVTMHGAALNVTTDLGYFSHINPCGFVDKGVTSMEKEGAEVEMEDVKNVVRLNFGQIFGVTL